MANDREATDPQPGRELFLLVYDELRRLAASELSHERPDHSLNPTALVHEAYLSLVGKSDANRWENRRAFFSAEAMRHILVDHARYHRRQKRGGGQVRLSLDLNEMPASDHSDVLAISEALDVLAKDSKVHSSN